MKEAIKDAMAFMIMSMDVAEVYSPERVVKLAKEHGLEAGFSFDITTVDGNGEPWDFTKPERRREAIRRIRESKPLFIVGSPLCTEFSIMQCKTPISIGGPRKKDIEDSTKPECTWNSCAQYTESKQRKGNTSSTSIP